MLRKVFLAHSLGALVLLTVLGCGSRNSVEIPDRPVPMPKEPPTVLSTSQETPPHAEKPPK